MSVHTLADEDGYRWVMGTHDPQAALDALQSEDRANGVESEWQVCATDMADFEYGWFLRVEPPGPAYECEYIPAQPDDVNAVPGVTLRP